jgi:SAM-dependent methyltransferase
MDDRIRRWDEKFARGEELHEFAPSPPLPAAAEGIAPGLALDLACGAGRHALWLAGRGWRVQAMDGSRTGIERMLAEARARGVAERIEARIADLEAPDFALEGAYDLVCDFYFLHRPLFGQIRRAVRPGGRFAAAIHVRTSPDERGRFLLQPGELRALVESWGWEILHHHEGAAAESDHRHGTAELIARRPQPEA